MRGDLVSRPVGDVLGEVQQLVKAGVKELLVISQNTSAYGVGAKAGDQIGFKLLMLMNMMLGEFV